MSRPPFRRRERKQSSPGAAGGLGLCSAFRGGILKTEGEEQWAKRVALLHSSFARDLLQTKQDKTCVARHRVLSTETVASMASAVRRRSVSDGWPVRAVLLHQGCERGTGDRRDSGAWNVALGHDADRGMETSRQFVSVT